MHEPVKTAIVGVGAWGKNVARELAAASDLAACVYKGAPSSQMWLADHLPSTRPLAIDQVLADPTIKGVAIVTPIGLLAEFARAVLEANKHAFVEKPLAKSAGEARGLANIASKRNLILTVGYLFVYHPIYRELKRRLDVGAVRRVTLRWRKFGTFVEPVEQTLLTHHLSLALDLLGEPINGTIRRGAGVKSICDRIDTYLFYKDCEVISLIDRASSRRSHTMQVELKNGSVLIWNGAQLLSRQGKRGIAEIIYEDRMITPLAVEIMSFVQAVSEERSSLPTAGKFASTVLRILEGLAVIK
jgi:predicted dehydrogenase